MQYMALATQWTDSSDWEVFTGPPVISGMSISRQSIVLVLITKEQHKNTK